MKFILAITGIVAFMACMDMDGAKQSVLNEPQEIAQTGDKKLKDYAGYPIVCYNVENLFDTENDPENPGDDEFTPTGENKWDNKRYKAKLDKLADAITSFNEKNPIVIGLIEVENQDVVRALGSTGKLKNSKYKHVHFDSPDKRGIDVALLFDMERIKIKVRQKLTVSMEENPDFVTRDILYVKGELMNSKMIHIFINHWPSRREGQEESEPKRLAAAKTLRDAIDKIQKEDPTANILVMGDLNDHPSDKSVNETLNATSKANHKSADQLINLMWEADATGEGTHVYNKKWDVLDHIIVSESFYNNTNGLGIENSEAKIGKIEKLLFTDKNGAQKPSSTYGGPKYYGGYSDHLPVYFFLK